MTRRTFAIVVMGVSGSGKSTVGSLLAQRLSCPYLEGDSFHSAANIDKMTRSVALTDTDRWPWLDGLGYALGEKARACGIAVATCSALKRSYRNRLRETIGAPTAFIHLVATKAELEKRMALRPAHYMPASLLDSQLTLLEPPEIDEWSSSFNALFNLDLLTQEILDWLREAS